MGFDFFSFAHSLNYWSYFLILVSMFVDANVIIITSVILVCKQVLNPYFTITAILIGGILEQFLWYWAGCRLGRREFIKKWADKFSNKYDKHFVEKTFHILIISKFVYGLHRAALIRSGMLNLNFKKFIKASLPSTFIWLAVMGLVGYFFSASFNILKHYFKYGEFVLLFIIILYVAADFIISKYLKKEL